MAETDSKAAPFPALSRLDRLLVLGIAVALFIFLNGPVWSHVFDWDGTIGWSYAAVPPLVLLALLLRHRLSWVAWLLHSLELIFWKFAITAGILLVVLVRAGPQAPPPTRPAMVTTQPPKAALSPPPAGRGHLEGRVLRGGAAAPEDTLVYVSSGLEDFAWPAPSGHLRLANHGGGFEPALAAAQSGELITAVSSDHRLHTLLMTQAGNAWRLNAPVLASGDPTPIRPGEASGLVQVTCAVHGASEHASRLVLLRHPFFRQLQGDGSFAFEGVPPGTVTLTAMSPDGSHAETKAVVRAGENTRAEWSLPAPDPAAAER